MPGEVTKAKLDALKAGINDVLVKVNALLKAEAYAESLPIIGNKLANATPALETLTKLSTALQTAVNTVATLSDLSTLDAATVASKLNQALANEIAPLRDAVNRFAGTIGATVDGSGNVVLDLRMTRAADVNFALGDLGMSGLGLTLGGSGNGNAALAYTLGFSMGVDGDGFWLDRNASNLSFTTSVNLGSLQASADLGILHFAVNNIPDSDPRAGADTLSFEIASGWTGSGKLRASGINADLLDFRATGDVDLDLHLQADMSNAALPSISADLHLDWGFSQSLLNGATTNSYGSATGEWKDATLSFTNVTYNFGTYVDTVIRPIVDTLMPVLTPIKQALAFLEQDFQSKLPADWRVPLDHNRDGAVTVLDLIEAASGFTPNPIDTRPIADLLKTASQVISLAEFLSNRSFGNADFSVGDYSVQLKQIEQAANVLSNLNVTAANLTGNTTAYAGFLNALGGSTAGFNGTSGSKTGGTLIAEMIGNPVLSFPLIENPLSAIKLLIGQDVDLFKLDMPAISVGTGMAAGGGLANPLNVVTFPIWPLPLVQVQVNVAAQVMADLAIGYDTAGIRYYLSQDPAARSIADIFTHGFYLDDQRSGGTDIAEFVLRAAVELAVITGVPGLNFGGGGNVIGTVELNLADSLTTPDGKLHLSDFPSQFGLTNPFAIFDVGGNISVGGRAWLDVPVYGNVLNYNTPRLVIYTLDDRPDATELGVYRVGNSAPVAPPPANLAQVITANGVAGLWLSVGDRAVLRATDNKVDGGEAISISAGSAGTVVVSGFGRTQSFASSGFTTIQVDAAYGRDEIVLDAGVAISARMTGGAENDYLQGGDVGDFLYGGTEDDYLAGGAGDDRLDGEDGNDRLEGGAGADALYGGNGPYDVASYANASGVTLNLTTPSLSTGDAAGDTFFGIEIFEGSNADDTMVGSAGKDVFTALDGSDTLQGMGGDDTLAPGRGTNMVDGGDGFDIVNYYNIPGPVTVAGLAGGGYRVFAGPAGALTVNDTVTNVEQIDGSVYGDTMTGSVAADIFVGREGDDTLDGGDGDDTLVGGEGRDTLKGGAGKDRASYILSSVGVTASLANPAQNTGEAIGDSYQDIEGLRGSEYNDKLFGDAAPNLLQGGAGDDELTGNGGQDTLQGGIGADKLSGGDGFDIASYYNSTTKLELDLKDRSKDEGDVVGDTFTSIEIYQGTTFSDRISGSDDAEQLWGEEGGDRLNGRGGDDTLLGGAGGDDLIGELGRDYIDGGDGDDTISGGAGIDDLFGGANDDTIHGDEDGDFIHGEAGDDTLFGDAGNDSIGGGLGIDRIRGGADDDVISGNDGDDFLYGDGGKDALSGGQGNDLIDGGDDRDSVSYYEPGASAGVKLNLGSTSRVLGGTTIAAFSALDNFGTTDTYVATGALANVEDVTGSTLADWIVANEGGSKIESLAGDDTIFGLGGGDTLSGGAGADTIDAGGGDDTVNGGEGGDDLKGGDGTDWLTYVDLNGRVTASLAAGTSTDWDGKVDTFTGFENLRGSSTGSDTLTGDTGANRIEGLGGNDTLDGNGGADVLVGGSGDDIYVVDNASGDPTQASDDAIVEESGSDIVKARVNYTLASDLEDLQLLGPATTGTGNGTGNRLIGNALANVLDGRGGADTFWGYAGNDTYRFDDKGDAIGIGQAPRSGIDADGEVADGGTDTIEIATYLFLNGTFANPTTYVFTLDRAGLQQVENARLIDDDRRVDLTGNALGNLLVGNAKDGILLGLDGDDVLDPGTGRDTATGGAGLDTLRIDWSSKNDTSFNFWDFTGSLANGYNGHWRTSNGGDISWRVDFSGIERFELKAGDGNDVLLTGDGDDIASGGGGDDYIETDAGVDIVDGGAGNNDRWWAIKAAAQAGMTIDLATASTYVMPTGTGSVVGIEALGLDYTNRWQSGEGNDVITTLKLDRNDFIQTNGGADRVSVFAGRDVVFMGGQPAGAADTLVIDWSDKNDTSFNFWDFTGSLAGGYNGHWRTSDGGDISWRVDFNGVERFELKAGAGNDVLHAGDGDDIVSGGAGNDYIETDAGVDIVDGGAGNNDRWWAVKSAATVGMTIDLATASTYTMPTGIGSVVGIEALGVDYNTRWQSGDGDDVITTLTLDRDDFIQTNGGADRVSVFAGRDTVFMGGQPDGTVDTLVVDWSAMTTVSFNFWDFTGSLANGYNGHWRTSHGGDISWRVDFNGVERFELKGGDGHDEMQAGDGNDILSGGKGNDRIISRKGVDIIDGGDGTDWWQADKSAASAAQPIVLDLTLAGLQSSYLGTGTVRGIEHVDLKTGAGNDVVTTTTADLVDIVDTGTGDDIVKIAGGRDVAIMGAGFDTLVVDWSGKNDTSFNFWDFTGSLAGGYNGHWRTSFGGDISYRIDFSGVERFDLKAGAGNDALLTGDGDDIVSAGGGNDYIETDAGVDVVDGGAGDNDRWWAVKSAAQAGMTIDLATASTYTMPTGVGSVVGIEALGYDYLNRWQSGEGADVITTLKLERDDFIQTNGGADRVSVFAGRDTVFMGGQPDGTVDTLVVDWSDKNDTSFNFWDFTGSLAGGYNGHWRTSNGGDISWRVDFNGVERFELKAGAGNDVIHAGDGDDIVSSGAGNDQIISRKGVDIVDGGAGIDWWQADKSAATTAIVVDLRIDGLQSTYMGTGTVRGIEYLDLTTGSGDDIVITSAGNLDDIVDTGSGSDVVTVFAGRDTARLGAGFDALIVDWSAKTDVSFNAWDFSGTFEGGYNGYWRTNLGGDISYRIDFSGVERFVLRAGAGNDELRAGSGDDLLIGGAGNDLIYSGKGVDVIDGGIGIDWWNADKSDATTAQAIVLDLTLSGVQSTYMTTGTVSGIDHIALTTGAGNDVITTTSADLNDAVTTGAGDDIVKFAGGRDTAAMGAGFDTLIVDWSAMAISFNWWDFTGSLANGYNGHWRTNLGGDNSYRVDFSGVERFELKGGSGADVFHAGDGDDIVSGGLGNDVFYTRGGVDIVDGGDGIDLWNADKGAATTAIVLDLTLAGLQSTYMGTGTVRGIEFVELTTGSGNDVVTTRAADLNDVLVTGLGDDIVKVAGGRDSVAMGGGFDTLVVDWSAMTTVSFNFWDFTGSLANGYNGHWRTSNGGDSSWRVDFSGVERFVLTGGAGNDVFHAGDGNDVLTGNAGNDVFYARGGNDLIDGGAGNDTMLGGAGDDIYVVDAIGDIVTELANEGADEVRTTLATYSIAGLAHVENLSGVSALGGQVLTGSAGANVILGGAYGDTLDGGAGDDILRGGTGDDFFTVGKGTNDQYFGDAGTDTVTLTGTLNDWQFVQSGGRVQMTDLRDAANSVAYLTDIERVEIQGVGSWSLASILAGSAGAAAAGTTGNDVVTTVAGVATFLTQGGTDKATGTAGQDIVMFGASYDPTDEFDGGDGTTDQMVLQGNYAVAFGPKVVNVEQLTLMSAARTEFGAPGTGSFSYALTFDDANVADKTNFLIQANGLAAGENLTFDGRAETNGTFLLYAGQGNDTAIGGKGSDGFYFGNGRFTALDSVDGFEGPDDQLGIRGDYSTLIELGPNSIRNITTFVLISSINPAMTALLGAPAVSASRFNIKLDDANLAAGKMMTVQANSLQAGEWARFDGSAETNGYFKFVGGLGDDVFIGGSGNDSFYGAAGADTMTGGAGNDTYTYLRASNSTLAVQDTITDFATGDRIDLSQFDAIPGGARDGFAVVADFTGIAGQLRIRADGTTPGVWFVEADTDGVNGADFSIKVVSDHAITVADFIL